jgi:hypothetical protein
MGQLIDLGCLSVKRRLNPLARRNRTITRRLLAIGGRPKTIGCSLGAVIRGSPALTRDPQHQFSRHRTVRTIARLSTPVPPSSYLIARRSYTIALLARDIPSARRIQTSTSLSGSQPSRVLTSSADLAANLLTGSRRHFLIASGLVLI